MPRGMRGAVAERPLATDALDLDDGLSYPDLLRQAGAYREPGRGIVHRMPIGSPYRRADGTWGQQTKTYPVASSAEEAREKTRATGDRWDYYEAGTKCKRCAEAGASGVISGWVLGGRKFAVEHDHVTTFDPAVYGEMEVDAPETDDIGAESPALMEA
jgi:hypothetical protein